MKGELVPQRALPSLESHVTGLLKIVNKVTSYGVTDNDEKIDILPDLDISDISVSGT